MAPAESGCLEKELGRRDISGNNSSRRGWKAAIVPYSIEIIQIAGRFVNRDFAK